LRQFTVLASPSLLPPATSLAAVPKSTNVRAAFGKPKRKRRKVNPSLGFGKTVSK